VINRGPKLERYEFPTLALVEKHCREEPEDLVWYIHNKGAR
jgi:hypothetical protein